MPRPGSDELLAQGHRTGAVLGLLTELVAGGAAGAKHRTAPGKTATTALTLGAIMLAPGVPRSPLPSSPGWCRPRHRPSRLMPAAALHHSCHPFDRGVSLNPATPVVAVKEILTDAGLIQATIFDLGFGSQELIPATLHKVSQVRRAGRGTPPGAGDGSRGRHARSHRGRSYRGWGPPWPSPVRPSSTPLARSAEPPRARFEEYAETLAGPATSSPRRTRS